MKKSDPPATPTFGDYRVWSCGLLWALALVCWLAPAPAMTRGQFGGRWLAELKPGWREARLSLHYASREGGPGNNSFDVELGRLQGLAPAQAAAVEAPVRFVLTRDAGAFVCEGRFGRGSGEGRFTFDADPKFAAELARLGYGAPSERQQFDMALNDVTLDFARELKAQGYERPSLDDLVEAGVHGVRADYARGLKAAGYRPRTVGLLIEVFDHGVSLDFVGELAGLGYRPPLEQLVEARDHALSADYIRGLRAEGYAGLSLAELIELADHGVDLNFIRELRRLGYAGVPAGQLISLRDHDVTADFIRKVQSRTGTRPGLEELIRLRDGGDGQD